MNPPTPPSLNHYLTILAPASEESSPATTEAVVSVVPSRSALDQYRALRPPDAASAPAPGIFGALRHRALRTNKELELAKARFDTELTLERHAADARVRESSAFWNAKSAEIAETIGSYVRQVFSQLELLRLGARQDACHRLYESASERLERVAASALPEPLKLDLLKAMHAELQQAVERVRSDALAAKYGL